MSLRKKIKRNEAKKQKADNLLFLAAAQSSKLPSYEKSYNNEENKPIMTSSILEELMIKHRKKVLEKEQQSTFKLQMHYKLNCIVPLAENKKTYLFVSDLRDLIKATIMCSEDHYNSRWCRISHISKLSKVIFIFVEDITEKDYLENIDQFPFVNEFFNSKMSLINPETYLISFENEFFNFQDILDNKDSNFTKLDLVLSANELRTEEFVLPFYNKDLLKQYKFTNDHYLPLSNSSLMFALDCEMVETTEGKEIAWIAVVNENLQCVYETYIKPTNNITNYLTKFSGITKRKLENVKTSLEDVQIYLQKLLPPDAIIIGHSVKYDLHALKLFHPYIIDTSFIYNLSNDKFKKPKLKQLAEIFLNREIQSDNINGHNPREDAEVTLQLVLLKLQHGKNYGDVRCGWTMSDLKINKNKELNDQSKDLKFNDYNINTKGLNDILLFNGSQLNVLQINPVIYFNHDFTNMSFTNNIFQLANENKKRIVSVGICKCNLKGNSCTFNNNISYKLIKLITKGLLHPLIDDTKDTCSKLFKCMYTNVNCKNDAEDSQIKIKKEQNKIQFLSYNQHLNDTKTILNNEMKSSKKKLKKQCKNIMTDNCSTNGVKINDTIKLNFENVNSRKRKLNSDIKIKEEEFSSKKTNDCNMVISSDDQIQDHNILLVKIPKILTQDEEDLTQVNKYLKLDRRIKKLLEDIQSNSLVVLVFNGKKQENGICFIQITN